MRVELSRAPLTAVKISPSFLSLPGVKAFCNPSLQQQFTVLLLFLQPFCGSFFSFFIVPHFSFFADCHYKITAAGTGLFPFGHGVEEGRIRKQQKAQEGGLRQVWACWGTEGSRRFAAHLPYSSGCAVSSI